MPKFSNRGNAEFAKYDAMSTEELQQILREDASKPAGEESDMETILYVMEVLAKRRKERNEAKTPEEALESFKSKYYTTNNNSFVSESKSKTRKQHNVVRWTSGLVAATVTLVLIIASSFTASAMDLNLWDIIVKWTQETFHFGYVWHDDNPDDLTPEFVNPCKSLQDSLINANITLRLTPTWLPEGYVEVDVKVDETPVQRRFTAIYQAGEKTIRIRIVDYLSGTPTQIEQSDTLVEVYSHNGVDYYIFNNIDQLRVTWITENLECFIMGPLTVSEIKEVINSIG